ncbi:hypothetical protein MP638_002925 [Amoeboaphelidium occidentale]|nr:hypothetical protein MP638_002925 [Amoeboaphelidium occidentale]
MDMNVVLFDEEGVTSPYLYEKLKRIQILKDFGTPRSRTATPTVSPHGTALDRNDTKGSSPGFIRSTIPKDIHHKSVDVSSVPDRRPGSASSKVTSQNGSSSPIPNTSSASSVKHEHLHSYYIGVGQSSSDVEREIMEQGRPVFICKECKLKVEIISPFALWRCNSQEQKKTHCIGTKSSKILGLLSEDQVNVHHFHISKSSFYDINNKETFTVKCCTCSVSIEFKCCQAGIKDTLFKALYQSVKLDMQDRTKQGSYVTEAEIMKPYLSALDLLLMYLRNAVINESDKDVNPLNPAFHQTLGKYKDVATPLMASIGFNFDGKTYIHPSHQSYDNLTGILVELEFEIWTRLKYFPQFQSSTKNTKMIFEDAYNELLYQLGGDQYPISTKLRTISDHQHYSRLGCTFDFADELIAWTTEKILRENPKEMPSIIDALKKVVIERNSVYLNDVLEILKIDEELIRLSAQDSYKRLKISEGIEDDGVIAAFMQEVTDHPQFKATLEKAIERIAKCRNSRVILNFCSDQGIISSFSSLSNNVPIGLINSGNTCYLNSLIQYYYTIKPLRNLVFSADTRSLKSSHTASNGANQPSNAATSSSTSLKFVKLLRRLFAKLLFSDEDAVLPDPDLVQIVFDKNAADQQDISECMDNVLTHIVHGVNYLNHNSSRRDTVAESELGRLFFGQTKQNITYRDPQTGKMVAHEKVEPFSSILINTQMDDNDNETIKQGSELFERKDGITDRIANEFPAPLPPSFRSNSVVLSPEKSPADCPTLLECLDKYFETCKVDLGNNIADKRLCLTTMPQILTVLVQRAHFDRDSQKVYKTNGFVKFDMELALDRYTSNHSKTVHERKFIEMELNNEIRKLEDKLVAMYSARNLKTGSQASLKLDTRLDGTSDIRERITTSSTATHSMDDLDDMRKAALRKSRDTRITNPSTAGSTPSVSRDTTKNDGALSPELAKRDHTGETTIVKPKLIREASRSFSGKRPDEMIQRSQTAVSPDAIRRESRQQSISREFQQKLTIDEVKQRLSMLQTRKDNLYADIPKNHLYQLHTVFVHQGGADYGHYWVYIFDSDANCWVRFNDALVEIVQNDDVFGDMSSIYANAYCFIYISKKDIKNLTYSVLRSGKLRQQLAEEFQHVFEEYTDRAARKQKLIHEMMLAQSQESSPSPQPANNQSPAKSALRRMFGR